jgi:hypothetical protein
MKATASSLALALCVALCGAIASAAPTLIAFTGFTGQMSQSALLRSLDYQAMQIVAATGTFTPIRVKMMCDDPGTSAAAVGAAYYIKGGLSADGQTLNVALYHVTNLIALRQVSVRVISGRLAKSDFGELLDKSHWSKATSPAGSC